MAYVDRSTPANRPAILATVAVLHAAAGYAIVTGLGVEYMRQVMPVFEAKNYPAEIPSPPPPPEPQPSAQPERPLDPISAPKPEIDVRLPTYNTIIELPPAPLPLPTNDGIRMPPPNPVPSFTPQRAKPRGNPGLWATTSDYPARDLREGNQGVTRFSLAIGLDGRVESCTVTASSGFPGLDKATCDNVSRRARFEPATDTAGNRALGTYSGSIRWVIPD